jgi:hypothetical protein
MIAVIPLAAVGAIAGIASSVVGTVGSFAQANKQKKLQKEAEAAAEKSMAAARKALGVNYFESLAVQKEKYELEREANLMQAAQATQALQEAGVRGVAGGVGRVALAQQKGQQAIRTAMGKEMSDLQKMTAQEESRLRDIGVQLDLAEAEGAQEAASRAEELKTQAMKEGITGAMGVVQQGISAIPLFTQNRAAQRGALSQMAGTEEGMNVLRNLAPQNYAGQIGGQALGDIATQQQFQNIGDMSNIDFRSFMRNLSPMQKSGLFNSAAFMGAYQDQINQ